MSEKNEKKEKSKPIEVEETVTKFNMPNDLKIMKQITSFSIPLKIEPDTPKPKKIKRDKNGKHEKK